MIHCIDNKLSIKILHTRFYIGRKCEKAENRQVCDPLVLLETWLFIYLFIYRECARVVLNIKWGQLVENKSPCQEQLQMAVSTCHQNMATRNVERFAKLLTLMDNPWTDEGLALVMSSEDDTDEEGLFVFIFLSFIPILRIIIYIQTPLVLVLWVSSILCPSSFIKVFLGAAQQ